MILILKKVFIIHYINFLAKSDNKSKNSLNKIVESVESLSHCEQLEKYKYDDLKKKKDLEKQIKNSRVLIKKEERKLRQTSPNILFPENVFEEHVGHFWGIFETRPFMTAKYNLIEKLIEYNTCTTILEALTESLDCLRLCRGDNMGVRFLVPSLYLKLNREQECYDFIKWWATCDDISYDWGDMSLPYLNIKDADIYEQLDEKFFKKFDIQYLIALFLIKIRIYISLQERSNLYSIFSSSLRNKDNVNTPITKLGTKKSIWMNIKKYMISSNNLVPNNKLQEIFNINDEIKKIYDDIQKIIDFIQISNKYVLPSLLNSYTTLSQHEPYFYSSGSNQESYYVVKNYSEIWSKSKLAIDITRKVMKK